MILNIAVRKTDVPVISRKDSKALRPSAMTFGKCLSCITYWGKDIWVGAGDRGGVGIGVEQGEMLGSESEMPVFVLQVSRLPRKEHKIGCFLPRFRSS